MKRTLLALCCIVVVAIAGFLASARAQEAQRAPQQWEYAELSWTSQWWGNKDKSDGDVFGFEGPERMVYKTTMLDFAKELGITLKHQNSTEILNALGAKGWELVSYSRSEHSPRSTDLATYADRYFQVWHFTRPK